MKHYRLKQLYVQNSALRNIVVTGYIRGSNLNVNSLVHITGCGDFKMSKIEILDDPRRLNPQKVSAYYIYQYVTMRYIFI